MSLSPLHGFDCCVCLIDLSALECLKAQYESEYKFTNLITVSIIKPETFVAYS